MKELLPILLIFACPLMMVFMMRGHRGSQAKGHDHGPNNGQDGLEERISALEEQLAELRESPSARAEKGPVARLMSSHPRI